MNLSPALVWGILGLILIIAEVFTASFVLVFFGVAALLVAVLAAVGFKSFLLQMLLFAAASLGSLLLFRSKLMGYFHSTAQTVMDENQVLRLTGDVPAHGTGQISYQGTTWTAVNPTDHAFHQGDNAVIERMDGVKIVLRRPDVEGNPLKLK